MAIPPQTGAGGQANTQDLLQQVLSVSGTGSAGMVPPGSTGITALTTNGTNGLATYSPGTGVLNIPNYSAVPAGSTGITALTTTGTSGPSTYSPSTGALNIPVYASGVLSAQAPYPQSTITFNSTTVLSTGFGFPFTANVNPRVLVGFSILISGSVSSLIPGLAVYRTTGAIPALGAAIGGSDFLVFSMRLVAQTNRLTQSASWIDTTLAVNTPYNYYLAGWLTTATAGTATILSDVYTFFGAFELK